MRNIVTVDLYHVNCTDTDYIECKIAYWLWRVVPFTLLIIGVFGNILNFVVLSRQRMRRYSTAVYLLFLAGSDMVFLLSGPLPDTIHGITDYRLWDHSVVFCRTRCWIIYTSAAFSVWLLVSLTIERLLLTKAPIRTRPRLTPKTSFIVSMTILIFLAVANSHCLIGYKHYSTMEEVIDEFGREFVSFPCNFSSKEYMIFYKSVWGVLVLVLYNIVPALIILIGNVNIAAAIILQKWKRNAVHPESQHSDLTKSQRTDKQEGSSSKQSTSSSANRNNILLAVLTSRQKEQSRGKQTKSVRFEPAADLPSNIRVKNISEHVDYEQNPTPTNRLPSARRISKRSISATRMLFTLTIFFMVTTTPYCLYMVFKSKIDELSDEDVAKWQLTTVSVLIFAWFNYAFNFFLYFMSGTLFKQEWKRLLQKVKRKFRVLLRI